ncbi:hypothetical protein G4V39_07425 [Thermosulfuriphilus ammonigenes]|uniref:Uncharacterized protein n=1 Tax=Thermosulfuriphilus ammonigenes TaxID=1936021 RepID=A0A6G7PWZ4_9BACT|nr:hypothetical protein [Thermosulfuriphilus ammonigenes]MBA2847685.1 hypothetical protein [Thermosulfuriphilus ammonigenes]QIJ72107.1 hypothetical protein G4V39_07425 [Thermosulfuriphilus ammonigenes]
MSRRNQPTPSAEIFGSGFDIFLPYRGKKSWSSVRGLEGSILKGLKAKGQTLESWLKKAYQKRSPLFIPEAFFEKEPDRQYDIRIAPLARGFLVSGAEVGQKGGFLYHSSFFEKVLNRMSNLVSALSGRIDLLDLEMKGDGAPNLETFLSRFRQGLGEIRAFLKALALYQHYLGQRNQSNLSLNQVIFEVVEFMELFTFRQAVFFVKPGEGLPTLRGRKGDFSEAICWILASIIEAQPREAHKAILIRTSLLAHDKGCIEFRYDGHRLEDLATSTPLRRLRRLYGIKVKTTGLSGDQRVSLLVPLTPPELAGADV